MDLIPKLNIQMAKWYDLQPLGTEGQGTLLNANAKYGFGRIEHAIRHRVTDGVSAIILHWRLKTGLRTTSSDYIDDAGGTIHEYGSIGSRIGRHCRVLRRPIIGTDRQDGLCPSKWTETTTGTYLPVYIYSSH